MHASGHSKIPLLKPRTDISLKLLFAKFGISKRFGTSGLQPYSSQFPQNQRKKIHNNVVRQVKNFQCKFVLKPTSTSTMSKMKSDPLQVFTRSLSIDSLHASSCGFSIIHVPT